MAAATTASPAVTTSASAVVITSFPLVPLTTTFKAPSDCSGLYQPSFSIFMVDPMTSCLPSGFDLSPTAYFSPGVICPSGYASACHDTRGVETITTVTCCPTRDDISLSCVNTAGLSEAWTTLFCTWSAGPETSLSVTLSADSGTTSTQLVTFSAGAGFNAYGIRMVHQSSDLATVSSSSSHTPKTNTAITTSGTSTSSSTTSPTGSASKGKGTSAGTIAAAVVVPLVVLAILGGIFVWWRKSRRQQNQKQDYTTEQLSSPPPPKWYNSKSELPAEMERRELSNIREPAELPVERG